MAKKDYEDDQDLDANGPLDDDDSDNNESESESKEHVVDMLGSSTAHNEARASLQSDVEAFLARGGQIQQIDDNVMADPPRKPQSNYGSRPI